FAFPENRPSLRSDSRSFLKPPRKSARGQDWPRHKRWEQDSESTKITLMIRRAAVQFGLNFFVDPAARELRGHSNRVLDGVRVRSPVANNAYTLYAQQRRAAVFGIIDALLEILKSGTGQHIANLPRNGLFERFAQRRVHHVHQALAHLQCHIANESVAHDHVRLSAINIAAFDIADEFDRQRFQ